MRQVAVLRSRITRLVMLLCFMCILPVNATAKAPESPAKFDAKIQHFVGFTDDGQISRGDVPACPTSKLTGTAGTIFITTERGIKLLAGSLSVSTGLEPMTIGWAKETIVLPPHSTKFITISGISNASAVKSEVSGGNLVGRLKSSWRNLACHVDSRVAWLPRPAVKPPCRIVATPGSMFSVDRGRVIAVQGNFLIDATSGTTIGLPSGYLRSANRTLLSVRSTNVGMCLENLSVPDSTTLVVKGAEIPLLSGRCAVIFSGAPHVDKVPLDGVARRGFTAYTNGSITVVSADFSTGTVLKASKVLSSVVLNPFTQHERSVSHELLKGAAALQTALAARGPFTWRPTTMPVHRLGTFMDPLANSSLLKPLRG